jgi:hypothetical protein
MCLFVLWRVEEPEAENPGAENPGAQQIEVAE